MNGHRRISLACLHLALIPLLLSGCDDSVGPDTVEAVSISPAGSIELDLGTQLQLAASAVNRSGSIISGHPMVWSSSHSDIASVTASGLVTAHSTGTSQVTAASAGRSASVTVTVAPGLCNVPAGGSMSVGDTRSASFGPQDCRLFGEIQASGFELELSATTVVRIDLFSEAVATDLIITDNQLRMVAWGGWMEEGRLRVLEELTAGRYFIWAANFHGGSTGSYEISVVEAHFCSPGAVGVVLGAGDTFDGTLDDEHCFLPHSRPGRGFRLVLEEAMGLRMDLTSSDFEPLLVVTDLQFNVRWWSEPGENPQAARVEHLIPAGEYIIWVTGWNHATGAYRLSMEEVEIELCPGVGAVSIGETVQGTLSQSSCTGQNGRFVDPWVLQVPETTTVQIDLTSNAFDAFLILEDANGVHLAEDDDGGIGLNSRLIHTVPAGDYRVVATTFQPGAVGGYQISVQAVAGAEALTTIPSMTAHQDGPGGPFARKRRER